MRLMEGEHVGPFNLGNPGEFTMLELAKVCNETLLDAHPGVFVCIGILQLGQVYKTRKLSFTSA